MVTGVETVGLVLAAFPLIIEGVKLYSEGVETLKSWRKARREMKCYAARLQSQYVTYLDTMEQLLTDIVQSETHLSEMLDDPGGRLWHSAEYENLLTVRLGRSYNSFLEQLTQMNDILDEIRKKLSIHESCVSYDEMPFMERKMLGMKIALGKEFTLEKLSNVDRINSFLRTTVTRSLELEPSRRRRRRITVANTVKMVQMQATSLYNCLFSASSWKCSCRNRHAADLRLQTFACDQMAVMPRLRVRVVLSAKCFESSQWTYTDWRDVDVESIKVSKQIQENPDSWRASRRPGGDVENLEAGIGRMRVRFEMQPSAPDRSKAPSPKQNIGNDKIQPISDLCAALWDCLPNQHTIGFLVDPKWTEDEGYRHNLYAATLGRGPEIQTKSLAFFLNGSRGSGSYLGRGDRLQIAVDLASSVLNLETTPWLKQYWKSSDISVHEPGQGSNARQRVSTEHPVYLSWKVNHSAKTDSSINDTHLMKLHRIRNVKLLSLAFALVELSLGRTLDELRNKEDEEIDEIISRLRTATRVLDNVYNESGLRYGDVVQRCLLCLFDMRDVTFDNEVFQQAVYDEVVLPLARDLQDFRGTGP